MSEDRRETAGMSGEELPAHALHSPTLDALRGLAAWIDGEQTRTSAADGASAGTES